MKILTLTNLYPPHYLGGYELACHDVSESLAERGHEVRVVTSTHGVEGPVREGRVARVLDRRYPPDPDWKREWSRSRRNVRILAEEVEAFSPDLLHVFNPSGLSGALLTWLHGSCPKPVVHDISDLWLPNAHDEDTWAGFRRRRPVALRSWLARLAGPATGGRMDFSKSYYRSDFLRRWHRDHGLDPAGAGVIHHGVRSLDIPAWDPEARGIVFAGRLSRDKGVHVLLESLQILAARRDDLAFPVTIAGTGEPDHVEELVTLAARLPARIPVDFTGPLERLRCLRAVASRAIYAFPVVWDEPFSIGLVEALAAGMPVVATRTGGTAEIVVDEVNGLLVDRADAAGFAVALERLLDEPATRRRLSGEARASVAHLEFERTVDLVERHLLGILAR